MSWSLGSRERATLRIWWRRSIAPHSVSVHWRAPRERLKSMGRAIQHCLIITGLAFSALVFLAAAGAGANSFAPPTQEIPRFRATTDLVRLCVTARAADQRIVRDLSPQEFAILADGVPQAVTLFARDEASISTVILFDRSGSMMVDDKIMHARDGVTAFLKAMRPDDEVALIAFGSSVEMLKGGFGITPKEAERAIGQVQPQGDTRLYDAVLEATRLITVPGRREKRAILILSDGADTASSTTLDEAAAAVRAAGAPVYSIGIELNRRGGLNPGWTRLDSDDPVQALARLSEGTGGWSYVVAAAKRCTEICLRVAEELRSQYVLGFYPPEGVRDGGWHQMTIRTTRAGVTLATRSGYFAPKS